MLPLQCSKFNRQEAEKPKNKLQRARSQASPMTQALPAHPHRREEGSTCRQSSPDTLVEAPLGHTTQQALLDTQHPLD